METATEITDTAKLVTTTTTKATRRKSRIRIRKPKPPPIEEGKSRWPDLPDLILENIFSYLTMEEKFYASMVCVSWNRGFYLPNSWQTFILEEHVLTRRKFNYYSGWQEIIAAGTAKKISTYLTRGGRPIRYILDHMRTQQCMSSVARNFRVLIFPAMTNFYNQYEFMNMLSYYAEQQGGDNFTVEGVGSNIHTLRYIFPCNMSPREEQRNRRLYGTGGKLLAAIKRLMSNLYSLQCLELIDLMLDSCEALYLLDQVCCDCCTTLKHLVLINTTKMQCQLLHVGVFINLKVLEISPQNLGEDVLYLLSEIKLRHLHIIQNRYTPLDMVAVNWRSWRDCSKNNPYLAVHLRVESNRDRPILWQDSAPVHSILYASPQCKLQADIITKAIDLYQSTLRVFGHLGLPRFYQPKSFKERLDTFLFLLIKQCERLHTLVIRERISTATVLLLATAGTSLRYLHIRRNAVILRCDWTKNSDWTPDFYKWLKNTSQSYEKTEMEVSKILGYSWRMLPDKEFKLLTFRKLLVNLG